MRVRKSTHFKIEDDEDLVKVDKIITANDVFYVDSNSIGKLIYLLPKKAGKTKLKLYKLKGEQPARIDSIIYDIYNIEIRN